MSVLFFLARIKHRIVKCFTTTTFKAEVLLLNIDLISHDNRIGCIKFASFTLIPQQPELLIQVQKIQVIRVEQLSIRRCCIKLTTPLQNTTTIVQQKMKKLPLKHPNFDKPLKKQLKGFDALVFVFFPTQINADICQVSWKQFSQSCISGCDSHESL